MRRRPGPRGIADAVAGLVAKVEPATPLARVQGAWVDAVGEGVAAHASPVSVHEGTLKVVCDSAVWAQEVQLLQTEIVARLTAALGAGTVSELRVSAAHSGPPGAGRGGPRRTR